MSIVIDAQMHKWIALHVYLDDLHQKLCIHEFMEPQPKGKQEDLRPYIDSLIVKFEKATKSLSKCEISSIVSKNVLIILEIIR